VQNSLVISGYTQQNQPCPFSLSTPDSISRTARYSLVPGISVCAPTRQAAFVPLLRSSSVELSGARVILWRGSDSRTHTKSYVRRACRLNNWVRVGALSFDPFAAPSVSLGTISFVLHVEYTPLPLIVRPNARTSRLQGNYRITKTRLSFLGRLGVNKSAEQCQRKALDPSRARATVS